MMRGTFANIRIKNFVLAGEDGSAPEGGNTKYFPGGEVMPIYDAAMKYAKTKTPLVVFAGVEYGNGSSRDWAAKGTNLLGVRAVIAESFERIHRSNLVGMGVLPLTFEDGVTWKSLGLKGDEIVSIKGLSDLKPRQKTRSRNHLCRRRGENDHIEQQDSDPGRGRVLQERRHSALRAAPACGRLIWRKPPDDTAFRRRFRKPQSAINTLRHSGGKADMVIAGLGLALGLGCG